MVHAAWVGHSAHRSTGDDVADSPIRRTLERLRPFGYHAEMVEGESERPGRDAQGAVNRVAQHDDSDETGLELPSCG